MGVSEQETQAASKSRRTRRERAGRVVRTRQQTGPVTRGVEGGRYCPLRETDVVHIDQAIRHLLANIGFSEAPPIMIETVTSRGGHVDDDGRLLFPEPLFAEALAGFQRGFTLYGQQPRRELRMFGKHVHVGSGGASPQVVDLETGQYRDSTLQDLYNAARMVDALPHLHFFSRSLVARDMPTDLLLDPNTAYACLAGTTKHVCTSITLPEHVAPVAEMCFTIAGSREALRWS